MSTYISCVCFTVEQAPGELQRRCRGGGTLYLHGACIDRKNEISDTTRPPFRHAAASQVYKYSVPTFGKGVVYDVDQKARLGCVCAAMLKSSRDMREGEACSV